MMHTVPFVANTPDNLHCTPACFMMIAKYFDPDFGMPMDKWAKICGFEPGKGTWANGGLLWFTEHGFEVIHAEDFDDERFIQEQGDYLIKLHGKETGQWMVEHTNMPAEIERTRKLSKYPNLFQHKIASTEDMKKLLDKGYLLRVAVNWSALHDKHGYEGHSVVVYDYDDINVYVHDPGLPPQEALAITWDKLAAISADPTPQNREVDAIRLKA